MSSLGWLRDHCLPADHVEEEMKFDLNRMKVLKKTSRGDGGVSGNKYCILCFVFFFHEKNG